MTIAPQKAYRYLLIGGGLANGLLAWKLFESGVRDFVLIEQQPELGGHHTWSFHGSDLTPTQLAWLKPILTASWPSQIVQFPEFERTLNISYHSVRSTDFHRHLIRLLPPENVLLNSKVERSSATEVVLSRGEVLRAETVLDSRPRPHSTWGPVGYQKFCGLDLRFTKHHGLSVPRLMDARVKQKEGFRFMYVLPWDAHRVLIEDTRYSLSPEIDCARLRSEIESYARAQFSGEFEILREEAAALPIPLTDAMHTTPGGDNEPERTGVAGGFFHPTTGYSLPLALQFSEGFSASSNVDPRLAVRAFSTKWRSQSSFYFRLNRMLFGAASDAERIRIFARFYHLSEALIARFYAGQSSAADQLRMLMGRPPVPIGRALHSLFTNAWMEKMRA